MIFDYNNWDTDELLFQAKKIAEVLKEKQNDEKVSDEEREKIEILSSVFKLDGQDKVYFLEIGEDKCGYYTEWHTSKGDTYKAYTVEGGIPEKSLLEKAPVKWLENLAFGVYEAQEQ